jgi:hypothetical protein
MAGIFQEIVERAKKGQMEALGKTKHGVDWWLGTGGFARNDPKRPSWYERGEGIEPTYEPSGPSGDTYVPPPLNKPEIDMGKLKKIWSGLGKNWQGQWHGSFEEFAQEVRDYPQLLESFGGGAAGPMD